MYTYLLVGKLPVNPDLYLSGYLFKEKLLLYILRHCFINLLSVEERNKNRLQVKL